MRGVRLTFSCELLSESYLCIIVHNRFYFSIKRQRLWIAFRIVSLHYRSQQQQRRPWVDQGCELLSESYLCIIVHNWRTFVLIVDWLWIAFRIVSLHYRSQLWMRLLRRLMVVNCFQNRIFALSFTTSPTSSNPGCKLWIAFRIVSLHYRSQREVEDNVNFFSCELLSESYLCIIVHNVKSRLAGLRKVVNCFQNRIFALSFTTHLKNQSLIPRLWIAFRIVSLHYRSQPKAQSPS